MTKCKGHDLNKGKENIEMEIPDSPGFCNLYKTLSQVLIMHYSVRLPNQGSIH